MRLNIVFAVLFVQRRTELNRNVVKSAQVVSCLWLLSILSYCLCHLCLCFSYASSSFVLMYSGVKGMVEARKSKK